MTYITTNATVSADIDFVQQGTSTYSRAFTNLQGSIGYSVGITGGSGDGLRQTDSIYNLAGHIIPSGETRQYDLRSLTQEPFGASYTITLTGLKAIVIRNHNTGLNEFLLLKATGTNAFTNLFRGVPDDGAGSGNIRIEPGGAYLYSNPYYGLPVTSTNRNLYLTNLGSGAAYGSHAFYNTGIAISIVAAGTSGVG